VTLDLVNGAFEAFGAWLTASSCRRLWLHWRIAGMDWRATAFFTAWGVWNLLYYPSLGQWASFAGGVLLVLANVCWVSMAVMVVRGRPRPALTWRPW